MSRDDSINPAPVHRGGVKIFNLNKRYKLNTPRAKKIVEKILRVLKRPRPASIEVVFLDDRAMRVLNKRYKGRDRTTDVLSFDLGRTVEVIISLDKARENSKAFGSNFVDEVVLYLIHGILHLSGYDDESPGERLRMSRKELALLEEICEREDLSKVLTRR